MSQKPELKRLRESGVFYRRSDNREKLFASQQSEASMKPVEIPVEAAAEVPDANREEASAEDIELPDIIDFDDGISEDSDDESDEAEVENIENCFHNMSIEDGIRYWALYTNASHRSINIVLALFNKVKVAVPKCARTLLGTNRNPSTEITEIGGGQLWYHGIEKCLSVHFCNAMLPFNNISLNISIDGLPLHRSGSTQFWPILFNIQEMPQVPVMTAAIFCGMTKPTNVEQYLRPMVTEMNGLIRNGIIINAKHVMVRLRAIIADTPARAFIKGVVGHAGYSSCQKCTVVGQYDSAARTVVFSGIQATSRTDEGFREGAYPEHQRTTSPLLDLSRFDIVRDVVVADRLHLIDLGIMKRLLVGWRNGTLGKRKWDQTQCDVITEALKTIQLPSEIHRKLRALKFVNFWKGSEYASFLHYASIVLLKEHLEDDVYWPVAGEMMNKFVEDYATVYGERYISSNVHNLQHIFEEVERFGPLKSISTYPFENKLQFLKGLLRHGWKSLEQAVNRLTELEKFRMPHESNESSRNQTHRRRGNIVTAYVRDGFVLQNNNRNCWCLTMDDKIVQFQNVTIGSTASSKLLGINGRKMISKDIFFHEPFESSFLFIFKGCQTNLAEECVEIPLQQLRCKLVAIPTSNQEESVFFPLLHTINE